jgi:hypothetical protein
MCDADKQYCCSNVQYGAPSTSDATFDICSATFCGNRRECDETADCRTGEVCCFSVFQSPPAILGSTCRKASQCTANDSQWIGCGSQEDCTRAGAPPCLAQECGGATLQLCGQPSRFACRNM